MVLFIFNETRARWPWTFFFELVSIDCFPTPASRGMEIVPVHCLFSPCVRPDVSKRLWVSHMLRLCLQSEAVGPGSSWWGLPDQAWLSAPCSWSCYKSLWGEGTVAWPCLSIVTGTEQAHHGDRMKVVQKDRTCRALHRVRCLGSVPRHTVGGQEVRVRRWVRCAGIPVLMLSDVRSWIYSLNG